MVQYSDEEERSAEVLFQQDSAMRRRVPNSTEPKGKRPQGHTGVGAQFGQIAMPVPEDKPAHGHGGAVERYAGGDTAPGGGTPHGMQSLATLQRGEQSSDAGGTHGEHLMHSSRAEAASSGHTIISKRLLQFSMLAEVISGSDDAKLAELALQLHTPMEKLRQWEAHWTRISGQAQPANPGSRTSGVAEGRMEDRQSLAALEAGDEPAGPHGEWQHCKR